MALPRNDQDLFLGVQQHNDRRAFDKLYLIHWERLYTITLHRTGDEDAAKDIVQDLFIHIWQKRHDIIIQTTVEQYLIGSLKYRIINYFASAKVKRSVFDKVLARMSELSNSIDDLAAYREIEAALESELEQMPVNMREAFILRLDELSVKEIATKLNLAEQTVSNNLTAATKRLKLALQQKFAGDRLPTTMLTIQVLYYFLTKK